MKNDSSKISLKYPRGQWVKDMRVIDAFQHIKLGLPEMCSHRYSNGSLCPSVNNRLFDR